MTGLGGYLLMAMASVSGAASEAPARSASAAATPVATFSIVAADPESGEVGVAVASKFFAVGSVVPWARAGVGAVATQSFANTSYGPVGLDLLASGSSPEQTIVKLTEGDTDCGRRQVGIVSSNGESATFSGEGCIPWAGGRSGPGYAVQGNILAGSEVVVAMERTFLNTKGDLAARLYAALAAGDAEGDSRGRQSAALMVARDKGGYGGFNDRYVDVRVDDHPDPIVELGRLVAIAQVNGLWNLAWTRFTHKDYAAALPLMEQTADVARASSSSVLAEVDYDLAVIRAAAGREGAALDALRRAVRANPKLAVSARGDEDMAALREHDGFAKALMAAVPAPDPDAAE